MLTTFILSESHCSGLSVGRKDIRCLPSWVPRGDVIIRELSLPRRRNQTKFTDACLVRVHNGHQWTRPSGATVGVA